MHKVDTKMKEIQLCRRAVGWHPWIRARRSRSWQRMKWLGWRSYFPRIVEWVGGGGQNLFNLIRS